VLAFAAGVLTGRLVGTAGSLLGLVAAAAVVTGCVLRWDRLTDVVAPIARTPGPVTDEAAAARAQLRAQLDFKQQVTGVLKVPTLRLVTLGLMAMAFGLGGIVYWVPTLMHRNFGIAVGTAGTISGLVSVVGLIAGTMYGGRLGRLWHGTRKGGRLLAGGGGLLIGSLLLGVALAQPSLAAFAVVLMVATGFMALAIPNLMASVADVLLATSRGIGFSMLQFLVAGAGAWSPLIVGAISDATGSLVAGMYALVVPGALSGVLVLLARRHFDDDAGRVLDAARTSGEE
jgi:MFS family permease